MKYKYDMNKGKKLFDNSNYYERIAKFMGLSKVSGMWEHDRKNFKRIVL